MTKWRALGGFAACVLAAVTLVVAIDLTLVATGLSWVAWLVDVAVAVLIVIATWGAFGASSPLFGRTVDGKRIEEPVVALTFDDGPSAETTPRVLDALAEAGARATFFVLGKHAVRHPELVERMVRDGHEVATHGYDHSILLFAGRRTIHEQLARTDAVLRGLGAPPVRSFRVPHGYRNPFIGYVARRLGLQVVGWSKGVFDTALPGPDVIVERSKRALRPGAILLLHDADGSGDGDRSQTADALPAILDAVAQAGLRTVTVRELVALAPPRQLSWRRIGIVVAAVAAIVTIAFERIDRNEVDQIAGVFASLSLPLVALALVANLVSVAFKATVWKEGLESVPEAPAIAYRDVVPAIFIGFLLNTVLIARIGEVGRIFVLQRRLHQDGRRMSLPTIGGTLVTEQVVLGVTLALLLLVMAVTVQGVPDTARRSVYVLVGVTFALLVGVIALEAFSRWRRRRAGPGYEIDLAGAWWRTALATSERFMHSMARGHRLFRDPRRAAPALAAGVLSWVAQLAGIYWTLQAFGIDGNRLGMASVVFLVSNLIGLLPVVPGNVGVFQLAVATALSQSFPISYASAFAFGIGLQAIEVALGAGLGLLFLSLEGLSFGQVRRGLRSTVDEEDDAPPLPLAVADRGRPAAVV